MNHALVRRVLDVVTNTVDPDAIVAGGYLRDRMLGIEAKDADVWMHDTLPPFQRARQLVEVLRRQGHKAVIRKVYDRTDVCRRMDDEGDYLTWKRLNGVIQLMIDDSPFDFMQRHKLINSIEDVIEDFDVGLCQIGMNRWGTTSFTSAFWDDWRNNTLTVFRETAHADRLRKKFPDRRVICRYEE